MEKVFEDYFSELQADMVDICLEYVDDRADNIYIYCSYEPDMYEFNVFYRVNGEVVHKHQLNKVVNKINGTPEFIYDVSHNRQDIVLDIGLKNLQKIHEMCQKFNRDMPTEIKLYYDVKQNSLKGKYRYYLVYSNDEELLPMNIFQSWFEEVKESSQSE